MGSVLVVDDDPTHRALLREIFEAEGYQVTQATEADAALDLLHSSPQRFVVVLDYQMPRGGGKRVIQAVSRDTGLSTRHSYVLLTARTRISLPVLESAQTLSVPVVRKPFDLEALLVTVAQAQHR